MTHTISITSSVSSGLMVQAGTDTMMPTVADVTSNSAVVANAVLRIAKGMRDTPVEECLMTLEKFCLAFEHFEGEWT